MPEVILLLLGILTGFLGAILSGLAVAARFTGWIRNQTRGVLEDVGLVTHADRNQIWPNGATTLPQALNEIYDRQGAHNELVVRHLEESKAFWTHHLETWHSREDLT